MTTLSYRTRDLAKNPGLGLSDATPSSSSPAIASQSNPSLNTFIFPQLSQPLGTKIVSRSTTCGRISNGNAVELVDVNTLLIVVVKVDGPSRR